MTQITKTSRVAFMKARSSLVVWWRGKKKTEDGENVLFFKALNNFFFINMKRLFKANLPSNTVHEDIMICYVIMLYY